MGNELSMCVEPENEAAERRFWRKESHGNVNFNNFNNVHESDNNANAGKFKVDNESRYERINIGDFGLADDDDFFAEEDDISSNGMKEDVKNKIASLFISTFPLSMLNEQSREKILNLMTKTEAIKNEEVQSIGQKQEHFYMVTDGEFEETDKDGNAIGTYKSCLANADLYCFGQMQLIHNIAQSETSIKCITKNGTLWGLSSKLYIKILANVSKHAGKKRMKLLKKVNFFKSCNLSTEQISHLSLAMTRIKYKNGEQIIKKDEPGAEFYIVVKGQAEATDAGLNNGSQLYKSGDCFGEQALINDTRTRQANVKAVGKSGCEVFALHRDDFTNLLGPYKQVMENQHFKTVLSQLLKDSTIPEIQRIANLGKQQLEQFVSLFKTKKYDTNDTISSPETSAGEAECFYIIYKGSVLMKTIGNEDKLLKTLTVKEYFGCLPNEVEESSTSHDDSDTMNGATGDAPRKKIMNVKYIAQGDQEGTICFQIQTAQFLAVVKKFENQRIRFINGLETNKGHSNLTEWSSWCAGNRNGSINDSDDTADSKKSFSALQEDDNDLMNKIYDGDSFEDNFTLIRQIGKGMIGQVFLISDKQTQSKHYAMKAMSKTQIVKRNQKTCVNLELRFLTTLKHPFIAQAKAHFQDSYCLFLILDFFPGGELFRQGKNKYPSLPIERVRFYSACVLDALDYMHSNDVIYRDLKPENVMIDRNGYAKVIDLGFAKILKSGERTYTFLGTPDYMAPEIIRRMGYGTSVDYFALGVLIYEKIHGHSLFSDHGKHRHQSYIFQHCVEWNQDKKRSQMSKLSKVDSDAVDIILQLTQRNENRRLGAGRGAKVIKEHPFFATIDFDSLRNGNYKPVKDIWMPPSDMKKVTENFRQKYRYQAPEEYDGDDSWCKHW
jgi:serine/threonine protein kinase/CRP-like cAMP-binding protein